MKNHLLASSAIIAVAALAMTQSAMAKAERPTLSLGGYFEEAIGTSIQNDDPAIGGPFETSAIDVHTESEIHVNGRAKLENGVAIAIRWEIEGDHDGSPAPGANSDSTDEHWMRIRGSFGSIELGSIDNAASRMVTGSMGSWVPAVGQNLAFDSPEWMNMVSPDFFSLRDSRINIDGDAEKINYYTPRMSGFGFGVSYTPNSTEQTTEDAGAPADADTTTHDGYSAAINYRGKMGSVGISAAAGYATISAPETTGGNDEATWGIGTRLSSGPFMFAIGVKRQTSAQGVDNRGTLIDAGARYNAGGGNMFSLVYSHGEAQSNVGEYSAAILSYRRTLGKGVIWTGNLFWADSITATDSSSGMAISTTVRLSF